MKATPSTGPARQHASVSTIVFRISLTIFLTSLVGATLFLVLNRDIATTAGRVTDSYYEDVPVSRKQTARREFITVSFTIAGEARTGKTQRIEKGSSYHSRDIVPVHYYPWFSRRVWFYTKTNASVPIFTIFAFLSLITLSFSANEILQKRKSAAALVIRKLAKEKKNEKKPKKDASQTVQ
jgi:hypothetical protein